MFWTLFAIDGAVFAILFYFFLVGLGDGSVSAFNIALWLPLVGVPGAVLGGGLYLRSAGRVGWAKVVLALLAIPGLLLGGFYLLLFTLFAMNPGSHH